MEEDGKQGEEGDCDLIILQKSLLKHCLCRVPDEAIYKPFHDWNRTNTDQVPNLSEWDTDRILKFMTCIQVVCEVSIKQNFNGIMCSRISDICDALVKNENGLVDQLIDILMHNNKFISYSTCKALSRFFIICYRNIETSWLERITDNALTTRVPFKMSMYLNVFKRIIEWKDKNTNPSEFQNGRISIDPLCNAISLMDTESPDTSEVKYICIKILGAKWPDLAEKVGEMITNYVPENECAIVTFLELGSKIISAKATFSIVDTKPVYRHLYSFFVLLNSSVPSVVWKLFLSSFNEVLCYGSALGLQEYPPEDSCKAAHYVMSRVKNMRLLDHLPFRRENSNFTNLNGEADKFLLQKMALLVLKSVAITIKEAIYESSSDESSLDSETEDLDADLAVIDRSIREVLRQLDGFVKRLLPFHPETPICQWIVQLFVDQNEDLMEAMVCCLDISVGLNNRPSMTPNPSLNPTATFIAFLNVVGYDANVLIDFLESNETCFLLYLLRILKFIRRNWIEFVASCGREFDNAVSLLIRLKYLIERQVKHALFPYNINPVLRLLRKCESLYENASRD